MRPNVVAMVTDIQRQRVEQLCREFSEEQQVLVEEFDVERAMIKEQHLEEMRQIQDIIHAMDQNFLERESNAKQEFGSTLDEIKSRV